MTKKKEIEDGLTQLNIVTIHDLQKFCDQMIKNGRGNYRFVVDFDWKYKLLDKMKIRDDSKAIILK